MGEESDIFERVLVEESGRQARLVVGSDGRRRVIRRLTLDESLAQEQADVLEEVRLAELVGFSPIVATRVIGAELEIEEQVVAGFSLGRAIDAVQRHITVNVALAIVHDISRALASLSEMVSSDPRFVHGHLTLDAVTVAADGGLHIGGLEGLRGDPRDDAVAVMEIMRALLAARASSDQAKALLGRLGQLEFRSCGELAAAIRVYLSRFDAETVRVRRERFTTRVLREHEDPLYDGLPGEEPTEYHSKAGVLYPAEPTQNADALVVGAQWDPARFDHERDTDRHRAAHVASAFDDRDPTPHEDRFDWGVFDDSGSGTDEQDKHVRSVRPESVRRGLLAPAASPNQEPHRVRIGDYDVLASIGRGGMGEIYLARGRKGPARDVLVALKVLNARQVGDDPLDMLLDEAKILARIKHPNVLSVFDVGADGERHFMAAEYLQGRPLVRVMIDAYANGAGLDDSVVACIGACAADGLHGAHTAAFPDGTSLGVVHRDVSPQNIFVTYSGVVKVIDFGVARAAARIAKTAVGIVKGKAAYMSPEQAEGEDLDARSDIFSLGTCLWEMAAGRRLFKKESEFETLLAVQSLPIDPPSQARQRPCPLDPMILHALQRDRDLRPKNAGELAEELRAFARSCGLEDPREAIRDVMNRLYAETAEEEQKLIASLVGRNPTDAEAEALRGLSGLAIKSDLRRVTWMANPGALDELAQLGEPADAKEHVINQVDRIQASRDSKATPDRPEQRNESAAQTEPALNDAAKREWGAADASEPGVSLGALNSDSSTRELSKRHASTAREASRGRLASEEAQRGLDHAAAESAVRAGSVVGKRPRTGASHRAFRASNRLLYGLIVAAVALLVVAVGLVFALRQRAVEEERAVVLETRPPANAGAMGRVVGSEGFAVPTATGTVLAAHRGVDSSTAAGGAVLAPSAASGSSGLSAMLGQIAGHGLGLSPSEDAFFVDDGQGGALVVDGASAVEPVNLPKGRGYVVQSRSDQLTAVGWIGSVNGSRWFVRGLTVNDCPATARIARGGIVLRYGSFDVWLPIGGGKLYDIELSTPPGARGLRVEPLGLELGRQGSGQGGCRTGWWGRRVVLRRLPPGRYSLRWSGSIRLATTVLDVRDDGVRGGVLLRVDDMP